MEAAAARSPQPHLDKQTEQALRTIRSHAANILIDPRGHNEHARQIRRLANAALNGGEQ